MPKFARPMPAALLAVSLLAALPTPGVTAGGPGIAAEAPVLTHSNDNLWNLSVRLWNDQKTSRQQWMVAVLRRNPDAFIQGNLHLLRRDVSLVLPTQAEVAAEDPAQLERMLDMHWRARESTAVMPALPALRVALSAPGVLLPPPLPPSAPAALSAAAAPAATGPVSVASAAAETPAAERARTEETAPAAGSSRWLLWPVLIVLAVVALGLWWWRRRAGSSQLHAGAGAQRRSRPRVVPVSNAAADMARDVERLATTTELVRTGAPKSATAVRPERQEAEIKLELARAQIELGQRAAALATLGAVQREGDADQQLAARQLLSTFGAA